MLLAVSLPLILLLTFIVYRLTRPKRSEVAYTNQYWQNNNPESLYFFDIAPASFSDTEIEDIEFVPSENGHMPRRDDGHMPPMDELTMDELTMPVKVPTFSLDAVAHLKYIRGGEGLPERLAIKKDVPTLFGRNKSLCDHVIDDVRVSRRHAIILQDDGHFFIQDEGSSGGTFVNQERLTVAEKQRLENGDLINFNEVAYQFTLPT